MFVCVRAFICALLCSCMDVCNCVRVRVYLLEPISAQASMDLCVCMYGMAVTCVYVCTYVRLFVYL